MSISMTNELLLDFITVLVEMDMPVPVDVFYRLADKGYDMTELLKIIEETK